MRITKDMAKIIEHKIRSFAEPSVKMLRASEPASRNIESIIREDFNAFITPVVEGWVKTYTATHPDLAWSSSLDIVAANFVDKATFGRYNSVPSVVHKEHQSWREQMSQMEAAIQEAVDTAMIDLRFCKNQKEYNEYMEKVKSSFQC